MKAQTLRKDMRWNEQPRRWIRIRKQNSLTTESGRLEVSKAGLEKNWKGYQALQGTRKTKIFSQCQLACKKFRASDREFANRKTIRTNAFAECHKQPMKLRFSYLNFRAKTSYGNECHLTSSYDKHKRSLTKKAKCQLIIRSLKRHIWGLKFSIAEFFW